MTRTAPPGARRPAPIRLAILTLLAGIGAASAPAHAQSAADPASPAAATNSATPVNPTADGRVAEVVVTATKRSTSLQKTPIAVTALNAATLADNHVQTMLDVVALVPGFQATAQGDHGVTTMTLRGIGNDSAKTEYADPEVATFVDNVYSPRAEGATALMFDVEGIEVLRGPQGTLWGRNSTVGAVNIQTVKPELNSRSGYIEGGIGDYNRLGARGAVNVPLSDKAALRFAVVHERHDGYVDYQRFQAPPVEQQRAAYIADGGDPATFRPINPNNFVSGGDKYSAQDQSAARLSLLWQLAPNVRWDIAYEKFIDRGTPSANLMQQPRPGQDHWSTLSDSAPWVNRDSHNVRSRVSWDINPDMALQYVAGWSKFSGDMRFDQDGGTIVPTSIRSGGGIFQEHTTVDSNYRSQSHELLLQSVGTRLVDWQVGAYYGHEKNDIRFDIAGMRGTEDGNVNWQGSFIQPKQTVDTSAVFGQATWNITDQWHLTGGVRYTHDKRVHTGGRGYTWAYNDAAPQLPLNPHIDPTDPANGYRADPPNDGRYSDNKATGLLRLNYDIDRNNMVYASVSTGYKSGGVQDRGMPYFPETLTNYEIGSKSTFMDGALRINNALFYMDFKDFQFNSPVSFPDGGRGLAIENADGAEVYGLETEIAARIATNGRLSIALAVLDTKLGRLIAGSNDYTLPACTIDPRIERCLDVTGHKLPHAPKFSTTVQYQHTFRLADGSSIVPRITARYEDEVNLSVFDLGPEDRQKAYATADLGLRYQKDQWWVDAFVRNVGDKKVKTSAFNGFGPWLAQYKPPRTVGINTGFDF